MKDLKLQNFRCFSEQEISFRSGINLLVGDNASGKTSILKACKYVLSAFFAGYSDENTKWSNPDVDDFREVIVDDIVMPEQPINLHFNIGDVIEYPERLHRVQNSTDSETHYDFTLVKNSKKSSRSLTTGIKGYKEYSSFLKGHFFTEAGQQMSLPLFASFSTEDIHSTRKINAGKFKSYTHKPSFGYYECLDGEGFFTYWIKRLLILQEGRENHPEITIVRRALQRALGEEGCNIIRDIEIRPIKKQVYFIFVDGREVEADFLSDGYRRLVNIVIDLAFRCALLNRGIYGEESCDRTTGTVLIDEIDLHLHPTLQSTVLKGLRVAFPNLQFIVSSHAPMVMSGVESNEENAVYKLDYSNGAYRVDEIVTYGMDLSSISEIILEQAPRNIETENKLNRLFDLIDDDKKEEAWNLLKDMRNGAEKNLPELIEAEALLNFEIRTDEIN